jgi:hypothetical protein
MPTTIVTMSSLLDRVPVVAAILLLPLQIQLLSSGSHANALVLSRILPVAPRRGPAVEVPSSFRCPTTDGALAGGVVRSRRKGLVQDAGWPLNLAPPPPSGGYGSDYDTELQPPSPTTAEDEVAGDNVRHRADYDDDDDDERPAEAAATNTSTSASWRNSRRPPRGNAWAHPGRGSSARSAAPRRQTRKSGPPSRRRGT